MENVPSKAEAKEIDVYIRTQIKEAGDRLITAHPWLGRTEAIAFTIHAISLLAMVLTTVLFGKGMIGPVCAALSNTFWMSTLHELEHDLVHCLYYGRPGQWRYELGFWTMYLFKFSVSPWWRRKYHLLHHSVSGTTRDVEERVIGLGLPPSIGRFATILSPAGHLMLMPAICKDNEGLVWHELITSSMWTALTPVVTILAILAFPTGSIVNTLGYVSMVCIVIPAHIRHAALNVVATYCHFYEDVRPHIVHDQIQILNSWWVIPFNALCWNFGGSHWIHHFVTNQPFWIRTLIAPELNAMNWNKALRRNDSGIVAAANRRGARKVAAPGA